MKLKSIHNTLKMALAAAIIPCMAACSNNEDPNPPVDDSPTLLSFNISLDKSDLSATRADDNWSEIDPSDNGYDFDNIVDQMTFRPVIYKVLPDNTLEKFVEVVPLTLLDPGQEPNSSTLNFAFTGMLPGTDDKYSYTSLTGKDTRYRMMIFTNGYTPVDDSIDESLTFSQIGNSGKPGFTAVPMWGVKEFTFKDLKKGEALQVGEIPLLRAMAMVRVLLASEKPDENPDPNISYYDPSIGAPRDKVDLVSISINKYHANGYFAPQQWAGITVTNSSDHKYESTLRIPSGNSLSDYTIEVGEKDNDPETKTYMEIGENGQELYFNHPTVNRELLTLYLPEVENNPTEKLQVKIGFRTHKGKVRYSSFDVKNGSTQWDIVRNHIYEYKVTGVQDAKISVEVCVKDWQYHKAVQPLE